MEVCRKHCILDCGGIALGVLPWEPKMWFSWVNSHYLSSHLSASPVRAHNVKTLVSYLFTRYQCSCINTMGRWWVSLALTNWLLSILLLLTILLLFVVVLQVLPVDLIPEPTQQLRRTRRPLRVKQGEVSFSAGFQPICVVQLHPPAVPTAIAVGANWGMWVMPYCKTV